MTPDLANRPPPQGAQEPYGDSHSEYNYEFIESGHRCPLSVVPHLLQGRVGVSRWRPLVAAPSNP